MTVGPEEEANALQGSWSGKGLDFQVGAAVSVEFCILKASFCLGRLYLSSLACLTSSDSEGQPHIPSLPSGERFCSGCFSPALGKTQGSWTEHSTWMLYGDLSAPGSSFPQSFILPSFNHSWRRKGTLETGFCRTLALETQEACPGEAQAPWRASPSARVSADSQHQPPNT